MGTGGRQQCCSRSGNRQAVGPTLAATILVLLAGLPTPGEVPPELVRLSRIKTEASRTIERLTDYTCEVLVERGHVGRKAREKLLKKANRRPFTQLDFELPTDATDSIELEVAVVSGREHFAWAGDERFENTSMINLVGFGLTSTGEFKSHLKSILVNGQARIEYAGRETIDDRSVVRYDYAVSMFRSGYQLGTGQGTALVPYGGSFWADASTDRVIRMTVQAIDIPVDLGAVDAVSVIEYQEISNGDETFLLPAGALVSVDMADGSYSRNEMRYSNCRSFNAASEISFELGENTFFVERRETLPWVELPAGLTIPLRLTTPIHSRKDRVGKLIEATIQKKIEVGEGFTLPKGALVRGRLRVLQHHTEGDPYFILGLELREIELADRRVRLNVELVKLANLPGASRSSASSTTNITSGTLAGMSGNTKFKRVVIETIRMIELPGVALIRVHNDPAVLSKGFWSTWRTK